jgi:hypothetical protein
MAKNIENRIRKVQEKLLPAKYLSIEDIIWILDHEERSDLTAEEKNRLEELRNLPTDPRLEQIIKSIEKC